MQKAECKMTPVGKIPIYRADRKSSNDASSRVERSGIEGSTGCDITCRGRCLHRPVTVYIVTRSTSRYCRSLPGAVLSVSAQKVPKEAAQRVAPRLAPARRATPPRPPQARTFVLFPRTFSFLSCGILKSVVPFNHMETDRFFIW